MLITENKNLLSLENIEEMNDMSILEYNEYEIKSKLFLEYVGLELGFSEDVIFMKYCIFLEDIYDAYNRHNPAFQRAFINVPKDEALEFSKKFRHVKNEFRRSIWRLKNYAYNSWKMFKTCCVDSMNLYNTIRKLVTSYYVDTYKVEKDIQLPIDGVYMPFSKESMELIRRFGHLLRQMRMYSIYCPDVAYLFKNGRTDDRRKYIDQYNKTMRYVTLDLDETKFKKEFGKLDELRR